MKKSELKELYQMMFPEYPDIVTVRQLRDMLGISRQLAYDLIAQAVQPPDKKALRQLRRRQLPAAG